MKYSLSHSFSLFVKEGGFLAIGFLLFLVGCFCPAGCAKNYFFVLAYLCAGHKVLLRSFRNLREGEIFDENLLMSIASLGAFAIGEFPEAAAVMLFYQVGECLQDRAADQSRSRIRSLMDLRPDTARILLDQQETLLAPQNVSVGQIIRVRPGERVALDGEIINGTGLLDLSALTGESRPVSCEPGNTVLAGAIPQNTVLDIRVQKTYENSTLAKIIELAEISSHKKSKAEKFITRFARIYTPVVVIIAVFLAFLPPIFLTDASFKTWIYRALIFLVISCPCALVLSVPLGFFGGIGAAARQGILVKGGTYLEQLSHIFTLAFDKTGTLTQGVFEVINIHPAPGYQPQQVLETAARLEAHSNHPIAKALLQAYKLAPAPLPSPVFEIAGEGVHAWEFIAGNEKLLQRFGITPLYTSQYTCVHVCHKGNYCGLIELGDRLKPSTLAAMDKLRALVPQLALLSGDVSHAVQQTAKELSISQVYAGLLPADKISIIEQMLTHAPKGTVTAFVGDGINDAPVLTRADVGIAMGDLGSDAAIEAADVVLMTDDIGKIATAIAISRKTLRIVKQNIILALSVKLAVLVLGIFGLANMWGAVFADVGVSLLAVLNSLRTLYAEK